MNQTLKRQRQLSTRWRLAFAAAACLMGTAAWSHGDVTPQAVDTTGLAPLGADWKTSNPYSGDEKAIKIGTSAFAQNCARCHGLDAVSGGIAPDLRKIDADCATMKAEASKKSCVKEMDEFYVGKVRHGVTRNGAVYMPPFEGVLSQEAVWSIKAYLETRREKPL